MPDCEKYFEVLRTARPKRPDPARGQRRTAVAPVAGAVWLAGPVDAVSVIHSIGSAMYGMSGALDRFDRASARLAQPASGDLVRDRVDQITAQRTFEANVSTVRTVDDMLGSLLDITA